MEHAILALELCFPMTPGDNLQAQLHQLVSQQAAVMRPGDKWQLYSYAYGPVHAVTEEQANAKISQKAIFTPTTITFGDQSCDSVTYTARFVSPADYLQQTYQAPPETIYLGQENMDIITTNCPIPGFSDIIRLTTIYNTTLIINQDGVFYFMYQNN